MPNNKQIRPSERLNDSPSVSQGSRYHTPVAISFRHFEKGGDFCLSRCKADEVSQVCDCFRKLTDLPWGEVLKQSGKGEQKAGLAFTPYEDKVLKKVQRPQSLSCDVRIAAVRFSQRGRVFGGYHDHVFYVLWFDPDHAIVPQRHKN